MSVADTSQPVSGAPARGVLDRAEGRRVRGRPAARVGGRPAARVPELLAVATVGMQIAYPLLDGEPLRRLTVAVVVVFATASVAHALVHRGPVLAARLLLAAGGVGLLAEAVGIRTGMPFGSYRYTGTLGAEVLGVPAAIPLAWTMMAYPAAVVGRRAARSTLGAVVVAACALAAWDLFLDPQMVAAGHWQWQQPGPTLAGIPLVNYAGWLATSLAVQALVVPALPVARDDRVPVLLYLWTWVGSVVAHLFFLGTPLVAVTGGVGMGAVVLLLWRGSRG